MNPHDNYEDYMNGIEIGKQTMLDLIERIIDNATDDDSDKNIVEEIQKFIKLWREK